MSADTLLFLLIRPLHVLLAAVWLGSTIFLSYVLMPTVEKAGPAGGQVMIGLNRRGMVAFFASTAGMTVLTGIYLYWRFTAGFDPDISRSRAGLAFGIGGACGIIAAIIGGSVVGRASKQMVEIMTKAMGLADGAEKASLMQQSNTIRERIKSAGAIVIVLQVVALILMAVGHYI